MKRYVLGVVLLAALTLSLHYLVMLTVRAPIPAEYWIREMMIVKADLAQRLPSPKIVFAGGSSTLFGIDAVEVEQALGRPALNDGFHAGLRLQDILDQARRAVAPGDTLVLSLEPAYYQDRPGWDTWQVRNAIAWDTAAFDARPLPDRLRILWEGGSTELTRDLILSWLEEKIAPGQLTDRTIALEPPAEVLARYRTEPRSSESVYAIANLDQRADILSTKSVGITCWDEPTDPTQPAAISSESTTLLGRFAAEMKAMQVRVLIAHTPYLLDAIPGSAWQAAEAKFRANLATLGLPLIDRRDELFFPRDEIYDSRYHLNTRGREVRTQRLIADLRPWLVP